MLIWKLTNEQFPFKAADINLIKNSNHPHHNYHHHPGNKNYNNSHANNNNNTSYNNNQNQLHASRAASNTLPQASCTQKGDSTPSTHINTNTQKGTPIQFAPPPMRTYSEIPDSDPQYKQKVESTCKTLKEHILEDFKLAFGDSRLPPTSCKTRHTRERTHQAVQKTI